MHDITLEYNNSMAGRVDLDAGTRRKRRPKSVCPNPLFVKWVEEWRDEAREKGKKSQYSYTKALNSIKKYPLPLTSGQEAKILDHVGEKLAKMLDKRLTEHIANGGTLDDHTASSSPKKVRKRSKDPPPSNLSRDLTTPSSESRGASGISRASQGSSSSATKHTPSMAKKPKKKRCPQEYIPVYRSGPYAILVALYNAEQKLNYCGYLNKSELISQAQPYCDTSFTVPDEGSYYTAWSSMSNLVKKGFVRKSNHPPRFSLTDAGATLAIRMLKSSTTAHDQGTQQAQDQLCDRSLSEKSQPITNEQGSPILLVNSPLSSPCSEGTDPYSLDEIEEKAEQHTSDDDMESPLAAHSQLHFWYVNMDGKCVHSKDDAAVTFNETVSVGFLVKCKKSLLESLSLRYTLDLSRKQDGPYIYAYLCNDSAPDFSDPPDSEEKGTIAMDTNEIILSHQSAATCVLQEPHGTSIVLSDSDSDSDMEVAPLADRIGLTRSKVNDRGRKRDKDSVAAKEFDTGCSRNIDVMSDSRYPQSEYTDFAKRTKANDGSSMPHALTPSQAAGLAALKRINQSSQQSPPPPVLDLTSDGSDEDEIRLLKTQSYMHNLARVTATTEKSSHNTLYDLATETSVGEAASCATSTVEKRLGDDSSGKKHSGRCRELIVTGSDAMCSVRNLESSAKPVMGNDQTLSLSNPCLGRNSGSSSSGIGGSLTHGALNDQSTSGGPEESQSVDLSSPEFVLSPGQFEVILCIDNSESTASRKSSSQFRGLLLQDLGKNGVKFDVRKLNVGDFVWVAKEKAVPLPGQLGLPPSREILLEHVVERKRMDDLAGSITDGRFHEQKFRLKQCGVRHPVYLVEEFGDISHLKLSARSLEQAISNTQIIDGFFVKRTKDIRDSVAYLTIMTRTLQQHYSNKTIKAYPWDTIVKLNKGGAARDPDVCSIAFSTFNEVSVKSKVLSVYEVFGRHLINLPNCSAEKAAAILEKYPTISHLREAYQKCGTESEREALLSGLRAGRTKRKLGPILSHLIYSLYWKGT